MIKPIDSTGRLTFDEENHEYFLDGKAIPSVTYLMQEVGLIDVSKFPDIEYYRERGKAIHKATELWDKGTLDEESVDERVAPYLDAYKRFLGETGFKSDKTEFAGFNESLWFAGMLDKIGDLCGSKAILDIKSNAVAPWTGIQLAGYNLIHGGGHLRFGLALKNDGTYRLKRFSDYSDHRVFESAAIIYNWKKTNS